MKDGRTKGEQRVEKGREETIENMIFVKETIRYIFNVGFILLLFWMVIIILNCFKNMTRRWSLLMDHLALFGFA